MIDMPAVLILGYRRSNNIKLILELCAQEKISKIFLSVDGPLPDASEDSAAIRAIAADFQKKYPGLMILHLRESNVGCAVSVLTSLDWVFKFESEIIVLEDDCIPTHDFFTFVKKGLKYISTRADVWLVSGNQFAPENLFSDGWTLSHYPLIWGWATNRNHWYAIRQALQNSRKDTRSNSTNVKFIELLFWKAGARRCLDGTIDAWDILLASEVIKNDKYALLPSVNLVSNTGDEHFATHTSAGSSFLNHQTQRLQEISKPPKPNIELDYWIRIKLYGISIRHLFTIPTRDVLNKFKKKKFNLSLIERWDSNQIESSTTDKL
jgi:hypothetical protein